MDFSFDFDRIPVYNPSDYNTELRDKINELEKYKEEAQMNNQNTTINIIKLIEHIKFHKDRLDRHRRYVENLYNKINELEYNNFEKYMKKNKDDELQSIEIQKIIQKQKDQEKQIIELQKIIQKQKEQEKQIVELREIIQKQKDQEKQKIELQEIIKGQKEQDKQIIKTPEVITQDKSKKRNFDDITNDYIERLTLTKKRSKPWSDGMSKYISITIVNDRWRWESNIFDENHINFKLKEDAEKHFETIIAKYNIDPIHITRIGYEDK